MGTEVSTVEQDLRTFADFLEREGVPPTVREFMEAAGLTSTSVADYHLKRLIWRGYLDVRRPGAALSRGLVLTDIGREIVKEEANG